MCFLLTNLVCHCVICDKSKTMTCYNHGLVRWGEVVVGGGSVSVAAGGLGEVELHCNYFNGGTRGCGGDIKMMSESDCNSSVLSSQLWLLSSSLFFSTALFSSPLISSTAISLLLTSSNPAVISSPFRSSTRLSSFLHLFSPKLISCHLLCSALLPLLSSLFFSSPHYFYPRLSSTVFSSPSYSALHCSSHISEMGLLFTPTFNLSA